VRFACARIAAIYTHTKNSGRDIMYQELIRNELTEAASVLQAFLADEQNLKNIEAACQAAG